MSGPLWVLALLSLGLGVYFTLHAGGAEHPSPGWLAPLATGVALAGILLAWLT
jgi:hypothetical protein